MSCNSQNLSRLKINSLLGLMRTKKYVIYTQPYKLNIVGVRRANTDPVKFDDSLYVFWKDDNNKWQGKEYVTTTDPSTKYLLRGGYKTAGTGTAILPNGQYLDTWKIGLHRGKYKALTQSKKLCVYRDYDRNSTLNFNIEDKTCGLYGINIHRAKTGGADDGQGNTEYIGDYSAGCQVFQNIHCFDEFMKMAERQKSMYGNLFTYTLFDLSLQRKFLIKRALYGASVLTALSLIGYGVYLYTKIK